MSMVSALVLHRLESPVNVDYRIVPGRDNVFLSVPGRRNVGMRPVKDDQHLLPFCILPLFVGPGHVSDDRVILTIPPFH